MTWLSENTSANPLPPPDRQDLAAAIEAMADGFALWDAEDRLVLCNSRYRAHYRTIAAELRPGVRFEDVMRSAAHRGQFRLDCSFENWIAARLIARRDGEHDRIDRLADGTRLRSSERHTADGGIVTVVSDAGTRSDADSEVRQSRETLRSMIDAVDELIAMVNGNGLILAVNAHGAHGFHLPPSRLIGRALPDYFHPPEAAELRRLFETVIATATRGRLDLRLGERWLDVSAHPVLDRHYRAVAISVFCRDITQRLNAEEEAREHQQQLIRAMRIATMGEMAAALAHELNQPIAAAINYCRGSLRRLERGAWQAEQLTEALKEAQGEVERAGRIIQSVTRFVRKSPQRRLPTDINRVIESAVALGRNDLLRKGIAFDLELAPAALPPLSVKPVEIEQTILNLLRNAIESVAEAGDRPGRIVIRSRLADADAVEVAVFDNGKGFSKNEGHRAFDPFFTTKDEGMGMGLAICRTIIEGHGGRIWVEEGIEGGAGVRFVVPIRGGQDGVR